MEKINKLLSLLKIILSVVLVCFCLYTAIFGQLESLLQRGIFFLLTLSIVLISPPKKGEKNILVLKITDIVVLIVSAIAIITLLADWHSITEGLNSITDVQLALGICLIICVLYLTKRMVGWPVVIIAILFLIYGRFGNLLPSYLGGHRGYSVTRIVSHLYAGVNGIFGTPLGAAATLVAMFTIYAAFLEESGGSKIFMDIAISLTGKKRGGPAKCAVVSSALFGMISGAAVTNVVTTGTFTIPLMKRTGYRSDEAGAIEAVASTGGQLMPPVMGTAAFIMADYLGVPYQKIALAALIPSILYYLVVFMIVHLKAVKYNMSSIDEDVPSIRTIFKEGWHSLISIVVLIIMLVSGYSTIRSALFGILTAFICSWFSKKTRITLRGLLKIARKAADNLLSISIVCGAAGIIIGTFSLTGMGVKLSSAVVSLAHGKLIIALLLAFITVLVLGMGMPTAAAYILVSTLVAPALIDMGVVPIAAHLFVLYGAVLSAITPPVAMAAYAASSLADENPMRIGFTAMKMAIVAFIIPFFFAYQPSLLFQGTVLEVILAIISGIVGCVGLSISVEGYLNKPLPFYVRIIMGAASLFLIYPGLITDIIGIVVLGSIFGFYFFFGKRKNKDEK